MTSPTQTADHDLAEIEAAARTDRDRAIDLAIKALGRGLDHPLVLRLVADGLEEDGRLQEAGNLLTRAREAAPRDVEVLTQFGRLLARVGRPEEALEMQREAVAIDPQSYAAHVGAGGPSLTLNDIAGAKTHFQRAHEIAPQAAEPLSALAVIAAREGNPAAARALAERALAIRPDLVRAQMAIAQADLAEEAPAPAEARLKWLLARADLADDNRADAFNFLAEALDALDRPGEAFFAYEARNTLLARLYAPSFEANIPETWVDQAKRLAAYFETAPRDPWRASAGEDRLGATTVRGHIFLMGFPRSGTTLLEQALASHPGVVALEEKPNLSNAAGHLLADDAAVDRLASLDPAEADAARDAYWRGVTDAFGEDISDKVFIDKLPLHTPALPLIAKLFPAAKIIFARRDPRDVVLSCFRRRFRLNAAMYEYLTLEGAARYYDQTMRLAELYAARLPLDIHYIRHEDLVADFEGVAGAALRYIGVDWDPAVWNFPARARARSNTVSGPLVARGLNAEGVGQWRRYQKPLAPVLALLEPWAKRFGYPPVDPAAIPGPIDPRLARAVSEVGAAVRAGDWGGAYGLIDAAMAQGLRHPLFHRLRGVRAQQEGRLDEAIADFETALADAPGDFAILSALGLCLARNGRLADALARLDTAVAINPAFAPAHYNRGWTLENMGDLAAARDAYGRAVAIDPRHAQAIGQLAVIAGRAADWSQARRLAEQALNLDPGQPVAATALAGAEAAEGGLAAAERRLRALLADGARAGAHERAVASSALGDVLDRLERPGEAFTAYEASGALFHDLHAPRFTRDGAEPSWGAARRLTGYFNTAAAADWRRPPPPAGPREAKGHVFLVAFPRSGTTMLGQALAGHRDAVTLDEQDCLADAAAAFMRDPEGLTRLAAITSSQADHHRDLYWRRARAAGAEVADRVFIDKLPMNALALPLVVKLFPEAKVLVLRRDPRDVVLSAFRRQFVINPTTVELLSLAGAARLYDAVMSLMDIYGDKLDLDRRVQSYETLVGDFDGQTRAICDFVGLDWRPGLAAFADRAGAVATPSAAQLARGLNAEGVGHWRRYRDELAPVMPVLAPWVKRFGYPID